MKSLLSERQLEVAKYAALGYTTSETAEIMAIAPNTVQHHKKKLLKKLHARNMANAVSILIEEKYLSLEELFGD